MTTVQELGPREGICVEQAAWTLHEAAGVLRVHYMTVYRYVRLGLLTAHKVKGIWQIDASELDAFVAAAAEGSNGPLPAPGRRRAPWSDRLESRMVAGDILGSWGVIEAAMSSGATLEEIYLDVVTPALRSVRTRCAAGDLDVAIERRASGIAMRIVGRLGPRFARRGRTRGELVVGAPEGDVHGVRTALLGDIIRQQGWEVSDLGPSVPASGFEFMALDNPELVAIVLVTTDADQLESCAETIRRIRTVAPTMQLIAGGDAIDNATCARSLGADHHAGEPGDLVALLERIQVGGSADRLPALP